jgi:hypothetical protein
MNNALDLEKSTRHATSFQNRIFKGFQMLALMDQHEKIERNPDALTESAFHCK